MLKFCLEILRSLKSSTVTSSLVSLIAYSPVETCTLVRPHIDCPPCWEKWAYTSESLMMHWRMQKTVEEYAEGWQDSAGTSSLILCLKKCGITPWTISGSGPSPQ